MKQVDKLISVEFICHGNICRSTMAEFVMKDIIKKHNLENSIKVSSAGTSSEELGNPVHPGTRHKLREHGISCDGKYAVQLKSGDYQKYDYLIGMEQRNITNMLRILGGDPDHKIFRLMDRSSRPRDIADPWYTGDFDATYEDVKEGCEALLAYIMEGEGY